ncbi:phage tail tube protein [Evansella tamaricis]|uniref:Capsid protein n=1 Tax=Evansella tamaricis TaxID=2069301 RepID=A0ABS6JBK9_9BACI|nr:capsid protein [Evansella tamaricis]MBU9711062.1 capsid protein [Evansella tamaricis]
MEQSNYPLLQSDFTFEIDITPNGESTTFEPIADGIEDFNAPDNEEIQQLFFLKDKGYASTFVTGDQLTYEFSGKRIKGDAALDYITGLKGKPLGKNRSTTFKVTNPDGATMSGPATITNIQTNEGAANELSSISFQIHINGMPEFTDAPAQGES